MDHVEKHSEEETSAGIFNIELDAQRRGAEAYDRHGNSVKADGLLGKSILQNTNQASGKQSGERIAPGGGETDDHQKRQIENIKKRKSNGKPRLQKYRGQRNQDRCRNAETIDLDLLSRCVGDRHV